MNELARYNIYATQQPPDDDDDDDSSDSDASGGTGNHKHDFGT